MEQEQQNHEQALAAEGAGLVPAVGEPAGEPAGQQAVEGLAGTEAKQYKTLGIRVDNELHAKLSFISQLRGSTLQGEIVQAIHDRVAAAQQDEELVAKAAEVRAQIEREARARQAAIAGMFGSVGLAGAEVAVEEPAVAPGRRPGRGGRGSAKPASE